MTWKVVTILHTFMHTSINKWKPYLHHDRIIGKSALYKYECTNKKYYCTIRHGYIPLLKKQENIQERIFLKQVLIKKIVPNRELL